MVLKIERNARSLYPNLKVAILMLKTDGEVKFSEGLLKLKKNLENKIRSKDTDVQKPGMIAGYNAFYKKFGSKVPMEFQIKSIMDGKVIPEVHPIITCMFMAELKNIVLTAGHDFEKVAGDVIVYCSEGGEEYTKINGKLEKLKKGDIFATDGEGIISSVLFGPDQRTRITDDTTNFMFMCYFPFRVEDSEIRGHMQDIIRYVEALGVDRQNFGKIEIVYYRP